MILLTLDPDTLEETGEFYSDYDSLAWNEKYQDYGDFQLRSYDIDGALAKLPLDTLVALTKSHTIMRVSKIEMDLSESGTPMVTISGKGIESIFEHRPAMWEIAATSNPDRKDYEFGDNLETTPEHFLKPHKIASQIYNRVNEEAYGYVSRFAHLKLPFVNKLEQEHTGPFSGESIPYYKFGGNNVWDSFQELMEIGQFHMTVARPGSEYHLQAGSVGGKPVLSSYNPRVPLSGGVGDNDVEMTLSAIRNDYIACKQGTDSEHPNVRFRSHEDGVMETWVGESKPTGLKARVSYDEVSIAKLDEYNFRQEETTKFLMPFANSLLEGRSFSVTTDGVFPMDPKNFSPVTGRGNYYLGDVVTVEFPWGDTVQVRVVEFIRTYDSGGSKEYPTFKPVLYTRQDLSAPIGDPEPIHGTNQKIRNNIVSEIKKGIYDDVLIEAFQNYTLHQDWL